MGIFTFMPSRAGGENKETLLAFILEKIKHQIRKSSNQTISECGIKAISLDNDPKSFKWWPEGWT